MLLNKTRKKIILSSFVNFILGLFIINIGILILKYSEGFAILTIIFGIIIIIGGIRFIIRKTPVERRKEKITARIIFYDEILKNDPNNVKALIYKGLSFKLLEQYEAAVECFNEALKIEPANPEALKSKENVEKILKKHD